VRRRHPSSRPDCQNGQREREADSPAPPLRSPSRCRGKRHRGVREPHLSLGRGPIVTIATRVSMNRHAYRYRPGSTDS